MMVLQNHADLETEIQGPCRETYTSCDESQAINIKVEVSDAEEEGGPVPNTLPEIKTEPQVRCLSLYVHCKTDFNAKMPVVYLVSI
jgi:hypothetical protein